MKKIRFHLISTIALFVLLISFGITFAWYVNGKMSYTPIIQAEDIEGINLYLYRGNDYDFNGSLDSRNIKEDYELSDSSVVEQLNKDLNKVFFSIENINDKITGIMDNNIATYRLRVINDTDKEYYLNPYLIFGDGANISPYNSILFRLRDINIYNHTFLDKDTNFIDYIGNEHFILNNDGTDGSFYEIKIGTGDDDVKGLYDTYNNPITLITNGSTYYVLEYDNENNFTGIYYYNELNEKTLYTGTINLSEFYNATVYGEDSSGKKTIIDTYDAASIENGAYDTYYSKSNYLTRLTYNYINQGGRSIRLADITGDASYDTKLYYPSRRIDLNTNLCFLMYSSKITTKNIVIDSFSEYYIDYHFIVDSNLTSLNTAISLFATNFGVEPDKVFDKDASLRNDYENAYVAMSNKISEMVQYSEIRQPNFKIEHFCFDMVLMNSNSSYVKKRGRIGDNV